MATEEQIRELAYFIWEKEGRPEGKHLEHYSRARQILQDKEVIQGVAPDASKAAEAGEELKDVTTEAEEQKAVRLSVEEHLVAIRRLIEEERKAISTKAEALIKSRG